MGKLTLKQQKEKKGLITEMLRGMSVDLKDWGHSFDRLDMFKLFYHMDVDFTWKKALPLLSPLGVFVHEIFEMKISRKNTFVPEFCSLDRQDFGGLRIVVLNRDGKYTGFRLTGPAKVPEKKDFKSDSVKQMYEVLGGVVFTPEEVIKQAFEGDNDLKDALEAVLEKKHRILCQSDGIFQAWMEGFIMGYY